MTSNFFIKNGGLVENVCDEIVLHKVGFTQS
jgi:hypothetical protein